MSRTDDLLPEFAAYCRQHALLPEGGRIVVGLSGGPDSMALIDLLQRLSSRHSLVICAAHLNHGLRADAADRDEHIVRTYCADNGIKLFIRRLDIAAIAHSASLTVEEAGRNARYEFFRVIAREWPASLSQSNTPSVSFTDVVPVDTATVDAMAVEKDIHDHHDLVRIAVGHHRDDQAETVLMNLCRGSGLQGLTGMMPRNGLIIRPLLDISRGQIDRYMMIRGLKPCVDQTNAEPDATRNRLRLSVLPAIQTAFGVDAAPAIARAASLLRTDMDYLEREASAQFDRLLKLTHSCEPDSTLAYHSGNLPASQLANRLASTLAYHSGNLPASQLANRLACLSVNLLEAMHSAIRTRVLRRWFKHVFGDMKDLSEKHVNAMDDLCRPDRSGHSCSLPGGRRAIRNFDQLLLEGPGSQQAAFKGNHPDGPSSRPLLIPGMTEIPGGGGFFVTQFIENERQIVYNSQIWCFPEAEVTGTDIRRRLPQDHIRPEGRTVGKTLKKYLIEQKIPASVRDALPLVARGSEILWIPGVTAAQQMYRPDPAQMPQDRWVQIRYRQMKDDVTR